MSEPSAITIEKIKKYVLANNLSVIALKTRLEGLENCENVDYLDCGPCEFLGFIDGAHTVITDSYHGIIFSTIFEKNYWSIHRESRDYDQSTRQLSFLSTLGIDNRYIREEDEINGESIDYTIVKLLLNEEIKRSYKYLADSLQGEVD